MITAQAATAPSWLPSLRAGARSRAPSYVARSRAPVTPRGHEHRHTSRGHEHRSLREVTSTVIRREVTSTGHSARSRAPVTPRGHEHRSLREVTSTGHSARSRAPVTPRGHEHRSLREVTSMPASRSALVGAVRWSARWPADGSPREFMGRPPCQGRFASLLRRDQVAARPDPLTWSLSAARRRSLRAGSACPPVPRGDPTPGAAPTTSSPPARSHARLPVTARPPARGGRRP